MKVPDPAGFVTEVTIGTREDYPEAADPGSRPRFLCGLALRACREIEKALAAAGGGRKTRRGLALEAKVESSGNIEGAPADEGSKPELEDLFLEIDPQSCTRGAFPLQPRVSAVLWRVDPDPTFAFRALAGNNPIPRMQQQLDLRVSGAGRSRRQTL